MRDTDNGGTHPRLLDELDLLEAETFEIRDHTEVGEELGSCTSCSSTNGTSISCSSCCG